MHSATVLAALAAFLPLVTAHGRINVATGDAGGNTTAFGIQGGVVPGAGRNKVTEVDTTVFKSRNIASDGLGRTKGGGKNTIKDIAQVQELSGSTLPQVSSNGGTISATYHVVTTDGAGPLQAMIDPTGTGAFSKGTPAEVVKQVPGTNGNISPGAAKKDAANLLARLVKRAVNVNEDFPLQVAIPAGTTCTGTVGGQNNVCLLKVANSNRNGPFGGVLAFQMVQGNGAPAAPAGNQPQDGGNGGNGGKGGQNAKRFTA